MRARLVAARNEQRALGLHGLQCRNNILAALDAGGVSLRADQHKIIIHHRLALDAEAILDELHLLRAGMDEDHIGITPPAGIERLPRALADHTHIDAGLRLEQRQDMGEQAGIGGRGG